MKSNLNNIDEIFREGLTNFAQEPESGLWKKISGKLLWRELLHFNFTNVPAAFTGIAAAGVLVTSLFVFNLLPTQNNQATLSVTNQTQVQNPFADQTSNVDLSTPMNKKQETEIEALEKISQSVKTSINNAVLPTPETPIQKSTSNPEPNHPVENVDDLNSNTVSDKAITQEITSENNAEIRNTEIVSLPNETQEETSVIEPIAEPAISDKAENISEFSTDLPIEDLVTPPNQPVISIVKETAMISLPEIASASNTEPAVNPEPVSLTALAVDVKIADDFVIVDNHQVEKQVIDLNKSETEQHLASGEKTAGKSHSSGKVSNKNSSKPLFGNIFNKKYKPPKRDFDEGAMALYRGKTKYISVSAYGGYERTGYTRMASSSHEKTWLGGASISYHKAKFVLQGGLELSKMNDVGDYRVDMSTYDSVGFYYGVGEFIVDPNNPDSVIFVIQKITVYDSVQHQTNHQTPCNFTYLQVPLMVGFKAFQTKRFSAYIKAGPSISFMINRKVPEFIYTNPEATIHSVNNYSLPRYTTSVQALVSLSLHYQLFKNAGILVEPTYRYYIQGVYDVEGNNLKKPDAFGIRGGIYYNFW